MGTVTAARRDTVLPVTDQLTYDTGNYDHQHRSYYDICDISR